MNNSTLIKGKEMVFFRCYTVYHFYGGKLFKR